MNPQYLSNSEEMIDQDGFKIPFPRKV